MSSDSFASRLQKALEIKGWKPVELANKTNISKALISTYLSGKYKAGQDKLTVLAKALGTNESWLIGLDVQYEPYEEENHDVQLLELMRKAEENHNLKLIFSKSGTLNDEELTQLSKIIDAIKKE